MNNQSNKLDLFNYKFTSPELTLTQLMSFDILINEYRSNNPHLHQFLKIQHYKQLIQFVTIVGNQQQLLRSYQFPQIASQILLSEHPRIFEILFTEKPAQENLLIYQLLSYFDGQPNYVLSSYVIKILSTQYRLHPIQMQQVLFSHKYADKMIKFIGSKSISEFMLKLIVVEDDRLLNKYFEQRQGLIKQIIKLYEDNTADEQILFEANLIIAEFIVKLFTMKHKQLGRFAGSLFKILELTLSSKELLQIDNLIETILKYMVHYNQQSTFISQILLKRILAQIFNQNGQQQLSTSYKTKIKKFTLRKFRLLKSLQWIFGAQIYRYRQILLQTNFFHKILTIIQTYEWNNLIHIEVQKIFKHLLTKQNGKILEDFNTATMIIKKIIDMAQLCMNKDKFGKGYAALILNISRNFAQLIKNQQSIKQIVCKYDCNFPEFLQNYIQKQEMKLSVDLAGYKVQSKLAKPKYSEDQQLQYHKQFLKNQNIQSHSLGTSQIKELNDEIESQNQMNKLLSISSPETKSQQCKAQEQNYVAQELTYNTTQDPIQQQQ